MNLAVNVQMVATIDSGKSKYESSCAYYCLFLFSGWWFDYCTVVALNGKYSNRFHWYSLATSYIYPNRLEMKIRRQ